VVPADAQGRIRVDALATALAGIPPGSPILVCLQAGNLHSGAFDPFTAAIEVAHAHGAWVHVDGAFGLWAAATPALAPLMHGCAGADSWATDGHKTLNVPYDCGIAVVADAAALASSFGLHASYLVRDETGPGNPYDRVPETSRRARGVPVWAALRSLGRAGVAELVGGLAARAGVCGLRLRRADRGDRGCAAGGRDDDHVGVEVAWPQRDPGVGQQLLHRHRGCAGVDQGAAPGGCVRRLSSPAHCRRYGTPRS